MHIRFSDLKRTNLACPSEWTGKCVDSEDVVCSFRHGKLTIKYQGKVFLETSRDEFDISGYLSDEDLIILLRNNDILEE